MGNMMCCQINHAPLLNACRADAAHLRPRSHSRWWLRAQQHMPLVLIRRAHGGIARSAWWWAGTRPGGLRRSGSCFAFVLINQRRMWGLRRQEQEGSSYSITCLMSSQPSSLLMNYQYQ
jgi:hypothetical protein